MEALTDFQIQVATDFLESTKRFDDHELTGQGIEVLELGKFFANWYSSILRSNQNPQR